jgi:Trypsin-co-occurring domain 1
VLWKLRLCTPTPIFRLFLCSPLTELEFEGSMSTELIKLKDGTYVEVQAPPEEFELLSSRRAKLVDAAIDNITPLITRVCDRVSVAMCDLVGRADVEEAEISLSLGFEIGGDVYIARSKADANLTVTVRMKHADVTAGGTEGQA